MNTPRIQLYFSHAVELLATKLAHEVSREQRQNGVFVQPSIVVPNANMQRYLQLQLASHNGVCANVAFPFLETGLMQFINQITGRQSTQLTQNNLAWSVWRKLTMDNWREMPEYRPLNRYLPTTDGDQLASAKRWQLSQRLAKLLLDYESQRPEMIIDWLAGKLRFAGSQDVHLRETELLQKTLYLSLARQEAGDARTLFQAMLELAEHPPSPGGQAIHVFTPSRLSQLHRKILNLLARHHTVHIYQLNVCAEYWEDVQTPAEARWLAAGLSQFRRIEPLVTDQQGLTLSKQDVAEQFTELPPMDDENPLLSAWGKPGREALKLFSELEEEAVYCEVHFAEQWLREEGQQSDSLLHAIQRQVMHRRHETRVVKDPSALMSLQLANAPTIEREVAAVYQSIVSNLQHNPKLNLSDVAVLVTDMNQYRFVIEQVFEEHNKRLGLHIPYAIVDSTVATESRYADAVTDLFQMLQDDLMRAAVFRWLDNPCVQAANQLSADDWQRWLDLSTQLGIYGGYQQLYHQDNVHHPEPFTWEQGLSRLRLALAVDLPDEAAAFPLTAEQLGQLTELIDTLYGWHVRFRKPMSTVQWQKQLSVMFEQLITVPEELAQEQVVQMALFDSLHKLAEAEPELILNWADIRQFIDQELKQIPAGKGHYLTGGVVCAALQPMRPIPFKITYVLGLSDTHFPGRVSKETLDLTHRSRRIGDINTIETNQYLFLETLMCTRERLYLSYVGKNLLKDEDISPSPVLLTLQKYATELLHREELDLAELPVHELPLLATHSGIFGQNGLPWPDIMVNFTSPKSQDGEAVVQCDKEVTTDLADAPEVVDVSLKELADYLQNPQRALLTKKGVLPAHPEDESQVEHEPFEWPPLKKHELFCEALALWFAAEQNASFAETLKSVYQQMLLHSSAPVEPFAQLESLTSHEDQLVAIKTEVAEVRPLGDVVLGDAPSQQSPGLQLPAIELSVSGGRVVRLHGLARQVYMSEAGLSHQLVFSSQKNISEWNDKLLQPFLHWCCWQLSDHPVAPDHQVLVLGADKTTGCTLKVVTNEAISFGQRTTIAQYLKTLVEDYLAEVDGFLPAAHLPAMTVNYKAKQAQDVPFLGSKSKSSSISYLAYLLDNLNREDRDQLSQTYQSAIQWREYENVLQLVECQPMNDYLKAYRQRFLPLYYMLKGVAPDQARRPG
ncbi:exodeoxyribonuclease V subunit gamma [Marinicella sediminis]|uniref:Exodeoxyribonuclease V subunit gamma n=1 Tax=Marinicella sediminis TaxID=1792834 RepID=A0ABV7J5M3_9GAMM|nr:exodeoxyribonuclease V subunit gamma [Marinicella sediminis]